MMEKTSEKSAAETKPSAEPNKGKTYRNLLIVTVIYLVVFYAVMMATTTCPSEFIADFRWLRYPRCTTFGPNELGDTLAGAFAPLAFLWLAGTVYIQSQELREQRRELTETRDVMKAQLALTEEQVKETRASTGYFAEQTAILKRQHELKEQEIADEEFDCLAQKIVDESHPNSDQNLFSSEFFFAIDSNLFHSNSNFKETVNSFPIPPPEGRRWTYQRSIGAILPNNNNFSQISHYISALGHLPNVRTHKGEPESHQLITSAQLNRVQNRLNEIVLQLKQLRAICERSSSSKRIEVSVEDISRAITGVEFEIDRFVQMAEMRYELLDRGWKPPPAGDQ